MILVDFLKNYHSKNKKIRYWLYLFIVLAIIIALFNFVLTIIASLSSLWAGIISTLVTIVLIILEIIDFGVKGVLKLVHSKLLLFNELYVIIFLSLFFALAFLGGNALNSLCKKDNVIEC